MEKKDKSTKNCTGRTNFANSPLPREGLDLSLDDSGDRWAQEILEISAKGENIATSTEEPWKGVGRSNEHRAGDL